MYLRIGNWSIAVGFMKRWNGSMSNLSSVYSNFSFEVVQNMYYCENCKCNATDGKSIHFLFSLNWKPSLHILPQGWASDHFGEED